MGTGGAGGSYSKMHPLPGSWEGGWPAPNAQGDQQAGSGPWSWPCRSQGSLHCRAGDPSQPHPLLCVCSLGGLACTWRPQCALWLLPDQTPPWRHLQDTQPPLAQSWNWQWKKMPLQGTVLVQTVSVRASCKLLPSLCGVRSGISHLRNGLSHLRNSHNPQTMRL